MRKHLLFLIGIAALVVLAACTNLITDNAVAECENLKTQSLQDTCYAELGIIRADINLCDKAENPKDTAYCYTKVAEATSAPVLCDEINDEYWQPICYSKIGIKVGDIELCTESLDKEQRNTCAFDVAQQHENEVFCRQIWQDIPETYKCIGKVALAQGNISACEEIGDGLSRDTCILRVAVNTTTIEFCDDSVYAETGRICKERVQEEIANQPIQETDEPVQQEEISTETA